MYGIPKLQSNMLAQAGAEIAWEKRGRIVGKHALYLWAYNRYSARRKGTGTLCFYLDDWRAERLWTRREGHAAEFVRQRWGALVMPDFSLWRGSVAAQCIWNAYRNARIARLWQQTGIVVAPSLSWGDEDTWDYCFHAVPKYAPVVYCQVRTLSPSEREFFYAGFRRALDVVCPGEVILYGDNKLSRQVADACPIARVLPAVSTLGLQPK
jgi:hypothetical protein